MSVCVATASANVASTFSIGPVKIQLFDIPAVSGDTSITVTGDRMNRAMFVLLGSSLVQSAVPTYSTNVATLTITDPAATVKGQAILIGI